MRAPRRVWAIMSIVMLVLIAPLLATPQDCSVGGVVKSASGSPVARVWVSVKENGQVKGKALTGDDGKFYLGNLDSGEAIVEVLNGNQAVFQGRVTLRPGRTTYDIPLP